MSCSSLAASSSLPKKPLTASTVNGFLSPGLSTGPRDDGREVAIEKLSAFPDNLRGPRN
jgi:hypothetical protein